MCLCLTLGRTCRRVPQALLYFGALEYRADLLATLEEGILLANGDEREVEIRAGSILAVEVSSFPRVWVARFES